MVGTAIAVWDLFDRGAASSTTTALALSPIAAAVSAAIVLPGAFAPTQAVAAVVVSAASCGPSRVRSGMSGRGGCIWRVLAAAIGNGLLAIVTAMPGGPRCGRRRDLRGPHGLAAGGDARAVPAARVPLRSAPGSSVRSLLITLSFVLIILGVQQGSPVVVQTLVATTPLFVLAAEVLAHAFGAARPGGIRGGTGGGGGGHAAGRLGRRARTVGRPRVLPCYCRDTNFALLPRGKGDRPFPAISRMRRRDG